MNAADLRIARKRKNMSVQMLADLLGVHRNTVLRWESGSIIPGPAQLSLRWILGRHRESRKPRLKLQNVGNGSERGTAA